MEKVIQKKIKVMGVINTTPDSFSDGGKFYSFQKAESHALELIDEGADILDIGGESTRPGSLEVDESDEIQRTIPLIEAIRKRSDITISIDTNKPNVMRAAVGAGANIVNSVDALRSENALTTLADLKVSTCLMHMQGTPRTMQENPTYSNVLQDVLTFLRDRVGAATEAGIARDKLIIDPGFGFGKTLEHNLQLLKGLPELQVLGLPVLVGMSRKGMIGTITGKDINSRMAGSLTTSVIAAISGADIIRVHDVAETVDAIKIVHALQATKLIGE